MSVPLDQLYNFLDGISSHDLLIYRWYPHGSKKLEHLVPLLGQNNVKNFVQRSTCPVVICHDQEPLDLDSFAEEILKNTISMWESKHTISAPPHVIDFFKQRQHLGHVLQPISTYDYTILLHSEQNSVQVDQCQTWYVPVYYWSHALIALDWFRYANIDPALSKPNTYTHDFLIYNRAWSGTREYRLTLAELIVNSQLQQHCKMGFSTTDQQVRYQDHQFKNQNLSITNNSLEDYFFNNTVSSSASADYVAADYRSCAIEVVLETLFDDSRNHLTEKILRPIACEQPFILVSTPGSLEYLRSYGFKTFGKLIDESYDLIKDPVDRLNAIVGVMQHIANMTVEHKTALFQKMSKITRHNQKRFFSAEFQNHVTQEFSRNFDAGMEKMYQNRTGKNFKDKLKMFARNNKRPWPELMSRQEIANMWKWIHKHN